MRAEVGEDSGSPEVECTEPLRYLRRRVVDNIYSVFETELRVPCLDWTLTHFRPFSVELVTR